VYFAGNSNTRGLYFMASALLQGIEDFDSSSTLFWTDRGAQKQFCMNGPLGIKSCKQYFEELDTTLVVSMTQRLEEFEEHLRKASKRFQPDIVVVEVGLDHTTHQYEVDSSGLRGFERNLDEEFGNVASMMEQEHEKHQTRFVWRAVPHFNQTAAWYKEWVNSDVDLWNARLMRLIQEHGLLEAEWFRWHPGSAELMDRALARQDGLGMEDWVHPNSATLVQLAQDLLSGICA